MFGKLNVFPRFTLLATRPLREISIPNTDIEEIPPEYLSGITDLYILTLSQCRKLRTLPDLCDTVRGGRLSLYGLNLICDCRLRWLLEAVVYGAMGHISLGETYCVEPANLAGKALEQLQPSDLQCPEGRETKDVLG